MNKQKINKKAVKLCGLVDNEFDIFTNSANREDTVIALGKIYTIGICATDSVNTMWFAWDERNQRHVNDLLYPTYIETIVATVEEVTEE